MSLPASPATVCFRNDDDAPSRSLAAMPSPDPLNRFRRLLLRAFPVGVAMLLAATVTPKADAQSGFSLPQQQPGYPPATQYPTTQFPSTPPPSNQAISAGQSTAPQTSTPFQSASTPLNQGQVLPPPPAPTLQPGLGVPQGNVLPPPQGQGFAPQGQGFAPQGQGFAPQGQGFAPQPAPLPQQGYVPEPVPAPTPVPQPRVQTRSSRPRWYLPRLFGWGRNAAPESIPGAGTAFPPIGTDPVYTPNVRVADLIINGFPARTGRIMFGGAVNSDAGVTGQITVDERNFDITRFPRSFRDLFGGTAFRGAGQTFRLEAAPGSDFDRYSIQFADPNLFGYLPISLSTSGFLYDRRFRDWNENRLGGRLALGYRITPDLSVAVGFSGQRVRLDGIRVRGIPELDSLEGNTTLYNGNISLTHNTRDSPIQPSQGHFFQFQFEENFGDFDYPRIEMEYRKYWKLASRADGSGKQTLSFSTQLGFSGNQTPVYEHFFAGGYATIRGFDFRGASPVESGVEIGGEFQFLNSVEYMFPITADDAFRGVAFCDFGTVERSVKLQSETFRVAPGLGLRVAIPALGPAPLAFDFAYPVAKADFDNTRVFSFYMSLIR